MKQKNRQQTRLKNIAAIVGESIEAGTRDFISTRTNDGPHA
ncbi:MAG TPA: hypothetical protein VNA19_02555 [Pyrinomonadaceae bacterium]|jgi:hypothetical protein|nr:hypothetical protein [Pyrinomonadaceae bacterium]